MDVCIHIPSMSMKHFTSPYFAGKKNKYIYEYYVNQYISLFTHFFVFMCVHVYI